MQPARLAALCEAPRGILHAVVLMRNKFEGSIPCHAEAQERESLESALGLRVITSLDLRHHLRNHLDLHCVLRHCVDLLDLFSALLPPLNSRGKYLSTSAKPQNYTDCVLQNYKDCDSSPATGLQPNFMNI